MTDEELMRAYIQGDMQAFRTLYRRHKGRVLGFLSARLGGRDEAEDVFQEVFFKVHSNRFKYRDEVPFLAWLFTIARNAAIDHGRKISTREKYLQLNPDLVENASEEPLAKHAITETIEELSSLNDSQRQALVLRFNEGLSFAEIADSMNLSQSNARKIVSRAVGKLRSLIKNREH
jgi:RNA polymerase sigma-70 factor (ECF subfamily)